MLVIFVLLLPFVLNSIVLGQIFSPQSTYLEFEKNTCTEKQKAVITSAWDSAVILAQSVEKYGGVLWDRPAEVDYLGQPGFNQDWQESIKNVIYKAATFQRGYWFQPGWSIRFNCHDILRHDKRSGCAPGIAAYTIPKGQAVNQDTIVPCKRFFDLPTCSNALEKGKKNPSFTNRLDIRKYACQGAIMLHEMFHLKALYDVGKQGQITDVSIYAEIGGDEQRVTAFGPIFTKALARNIALDMGRWVNKNADSLAYYALAKWIQGNINVYPSLPHSVSVGSRPQPGITALSFSNGTLSITNATELLLDTGFTSLEQLVGNGCQAGDLTCKTSDETVKIDGVTEALSFQSGSTPVTPGSSKERWVPQCRSVPADSSTVTEDEAINAINQFCSNSSIMNHPVTAMTKGYEHNGFPIGIPMRAWLWLGVGHSRDNCLDPVKIYGTQCQTALRRVLNGCDTNTTTKKAGGYLEIPLSCVRYWLYPVDGSDYEPSGSDPAVVV